MDGKYNITANTPVGTHKGTIEIVTDDNDFRAHIILMDNDIHANGQRNGDRFTFNCRFTAQYEVVYLRVDGNVSNNSLSAKTMTPYGSATITGEKCE